MERLAGILSMICGLIAFAAALFMGRFQLLSVAVAVIFFFIGGTSLSRANQIRKAIKPLALLAQGRPAGSSEDGARPDRDS
jgi:predicted membrane protein